MPDAHPVRVGATLGDHLDHLTLELREQSNMSPEGSFKRICARLSRIDPFSSAGIFRFDEASQALEWMHLSDAAPETMRSSLSRYATRISNMLGNGSLFQQDGSEPARVPNEVFIGLPAGTFDGAPVGLGLSSSRLLQTEERARLKSFGLIAGLMTENTRLERMIGGGDDAGSTARLIGFIAHELRTPLTGMRGNIQLALMATRKGQHDRIPNRLEAAITSVDDMTELVQKLLDVSRLERGTFPLSPSDGELGDTLSRAVETFNSQSDAPGHRVQYERSAAVRYSHDHEALERAFWYLLTYAARYSEEGSELSLSLKADDQGSQVNITYSGVGFSGDDLAALSAPLSSSKPSSERSDNLSLELAFCRGVIQEHGGRIGLHTDKPAPGQQTIEVILPV